MQIKILSLNLFEGGKLWDNIAKFITRENFDILCLQEVYNGDSNQPGNFQSLTRLKKLLPEYFFHYSPEMYETWPEGQGDQGNAIFSRFPISKTNTIFLHRQYNKFIRSQHGSGFAHYPKNMIYAGINISGLELNVFNLHGIWGLDGKDTDERLAMSDKIVNQIKEKKNTILTGDFNINPNTKTIENIERHLQNVFKGEFKSTFNMKYKTDSGYATAVVDMVFISPNLKIIEKRSSLDDLSDHRPLIVSFEAK
ncbi:endonuclease/exonuclease/phosphatase family protein [Candidatus Gottesmanbacteria bacterium]|nr:endonuclease/exonuclease/phosphatase family protein [Candidatus Gottesmanbacteria bacterium]